MLTATDKVEKSERKGASLVCDITQGINEMALQRLKELPIKYIKIPQLHTENVSCSRILCHPKDLSSSWWHISPMKPSASLRVKLRKSPSEIQSTCAHGKGCLCRHSEKPAPTVLERNHMNRCYQSAVRLPSREIWRHLWDTNVQMGMFPKTALAFLTG